MFWARFLSGILPHFCAWKYIATISKPLLEAAQKYPLSQRKQTNPRFAAGFFIAQLRLQTT
jgi:hypothetical protein